MYLSENNGTESKKLLKVMYSSRVEICLFLSINESMHKSSVMKFIFGDFKKLLLIRVPFMSRLQWDGSNFCQITFFHPFQLAAEIEHFPLEMSE